MDWKFQSETLQHFDKSRFVGTVAVYHYKCLLQNCFINLMDEIALDIHDIASYLKKLVIQKNPSRLSKCLDYVVVKVNQHIKYQYMSLC